MTTNPRSPSQPVEELVSFMERIYRYRLTTTSGGNLSIRDNHGTIWITPSAIDKGTLKPQDIVCVQPTGIVEGKHKPSSEYPFHQLIYEARPDLHAIVHAHPVALVAFSICGQRPNTHAFNRAHAVCGEVGFAPYAVPGSVKLGQNIAAEFARGFNCVMLENHGVVVGGATLEEAFERFETLEFTARIILKAKALGGEIKYLTPAQMALAHDLFQFYPEFTPPTADLPEERLRHDLCTFIQRGYRQRLLTAAQGSFSARVEKDSFLITPAEVDRATIKNADLVLLKDGRQEKGKTPSRSVNLHRAIYRAHPDIHSIVMATPPNATAYSITFQGLDSRTIPESYIFLRDVKRIAYDSVYGPGDDVAAVLSMSSPTAILENSGVIVVGESILDAFDRLEVLESTADAIINASTLGPIRTMDPQAILELEKVFFH